MPAQPGGEVGHLFGAAAGQPGSALPAVVGGGWLWSALPKEDGLCAGLAGEG
ncbi:hypothetical protein OH809_05050 [Streptomyces sp. NBC_00873]|uniref:hypothetical protein n=1 Tax=Streptomyces sp. NBC_00873 TaxID=2975852 RepID=UPI0038708A79|nr:hypothetical protein OH809_05050 [Streptomyces sp. NBC_00873]